MLCLGLIVRGRRGIRNIRPATQPTIPTARQPVSRDRAWRNFPKAAPGNGIGVDIDRDGNQLWCSIAAAPRPAWDRASRRSEFDAGGRLVVSFGPA